MELGRRSELPLDSFIVVTPHIRGGQFHDQPQIVRQILNDVLGKYKADPKCIHLAGLSRGAVSLTLAAFH